MQCHNVIITLRLLRWLFCFLHTRRLWHLLLCFGCMLLWCFAFLLRFLRWLMNHIKIKFTHADISTFTNYHCWYCINQHSGPGYKFNYSENFYTVCKNSHNCFHHNCIKFQPTLIIFGTDMAKTIELCNVYSFSTSPNLCQCTTLWNTGASNCYITWQLFVSNRSPLHHQFDRRSYAN